MISSAAIAYMREHGESWTSQEWADALGVSRMSVFAAAVEHDFCMQASMGDESGRRHEGRVAKLAAALADLPPDPKPEKPAFHVEPKPRRSAPVQEVKREPRPVLPKPRHQRTAPDAVDDPEAFLDWRLAVIRRAAEAIRLEAGAAHEELHL